MSDKKILNNPLHEYGAGIVHVSFKTLTRFACVLFMLASTSTRAETYLGLEPLQPLSAVRQRFSANQLLPEQAAWLKPNQSFFKLQTKEAGGVVMLLFEHDDETRKKKLSELEKAIAGLPAQAQARSSRLMIRQFREKLERPLDDRLALILIRWIPDQPVRLADLITQHGKPDIRRAPDATYSPVVVWNKGINAHLTTDKKSVRMLEYWFTEDDLAVYFLRRDTSSP